jgi:hypothetical protein
MVDRIGGAEGDRTPDLMNAIHALSQLSYGPVLFSARSWPGLMSVCAMIEEKLFWFNFASPN